MANIKLPTLQGSEKQVAWATSIRNEYINRVDIFIDQLVEFSIIVEAQMSVCDTSSQDRVFFMEKLIIKKLEKFLQNENAKFWIDNRDRYFRFLLETVEVEDEAEDAETKEVETVETKVEEIKMSTLVSWLCEKEPEIVRDMQNSHHNFKQGEVNPFHIEGDCWSHTMMVCKVAELKNYDKIVQVSALLHDIGKPSCRAVDEKQGFVFYTGHEKVSAKMARRVVDRMRKPFRLSKGDRAWIVKLILSHSDFYKLKEKELIEKYKGRAEFFEKLSQLVECDLQGSYATMGGVDWDRIERVKSKL